MKNTIADKVGVMNIIDAMRLEAQGVSDYLNTEAQKKKMIESIEQSYRAQGVEVERSIVDKGIEQWYKDRLELKKTDLNMLSSLYMKRKEWLNEAMMVIAVIAVTITAFFFYIAIVLSGAREQINEALSVVEANNKSIILEKSKIISLVDELPGGSGRYAFINEAPGRIDRNISEMNSIALKVKQEADLRLKEIQDDVTPNTSVIISLLDSHKDLLQNSINVNAEVKEFGALVHEFNSLKSNANIVEMKALQDAVDEVELMLLAPGMKIEAFSGSVGNLRGMVSRSGHLIPLKNEISKLEKRLFSQLTIQSDKDQVNSILKRIYIAIDALKDPVVADVTSIRESERLSRTEINLIVLPDNTKKSGYERTYDASNGKSYYAIAVAIDEAGEPIEMKVKSRETGQEKMASTFGVRVDIAGWERLKKDKLSDGIINDNKIGIKPFGTLDIQFEPGYSEEYILEW